jgi:RNA polymerase sigma factor (TIGR02999 family)
MGDGEVTRLLNEVRAGKHGAESQLFTVVYDELRRVAAGRLRQEFRHRHHTLQATGLVHEAFLRLAGEQIPWQNRGHFFGIAARVMRQILIEEVRRIQAEKRGGGATHVPIHQAPDVVARANQEIIELDEALTRLASIDPRHARIVELRVFTGLTIAEVAEVLGCSTRLVNRHWRIAQAWLRVALASRRHA